MRFLFIHQNMPGQYKNFLLRLAQMKQHQLVFLTQRKQRIEIEGVEQVIYAPSREPRVDTHHYMRDYERHILNAQGVYRALVELKQRGFKPDICLGHNGWGEIWFVKDIWPDVPVVGYFEFFYNHRGADMGFDPEYPSVPDDGPRVRIKNAGNLTGLHVSDHGQSPTSWQHQQYPDWARRKITVLFDGIDTRVLTPDPRARVTIAGRTGALTRDDEVITYIARNLEPYRGFHVFMRALPEIQKRRPKAHIVILGGDGVSYGRKLPPGQTYRENLMKEVGDQLDLSRIHFVGQVPYSSFMGILRVSRAHVYLTYPFVLSWSMLEAMSMGAVVIGSRTGPVIEALRHGENGFLVDFFDRGQLLDTLDDVLNRHAQMGPIREAARASVVQRYDLDSVCWPGFLKMVDGVLGR